MPKQKYEGGKIVGLDGQHVSEHYHVDYFVGEGEDAEYGWGYVINVYDTGFVVHDTSERDVLKSCATLKDAVAFCFEEYAKQNPGKLISPCWGAGAPNDTLEQLGYSSGWPPQKIQ